jgi:hypothetical protein
MHGDRNVYSNNYVLGPMFNQNVVRLTDLLALYRLNRATAIASGDDEDDFEYNRAGDVMANGGPRKLFTAVGKNHDDEDMILVSLNPKFDQVGTHDPPTIDDSPIAVNVRDADENPHLKGKCPPPSFNPALAAVAARRSSCWRNQGRQLRQVIPHRVTSKCRCSDMVLEGYTPQLLVRQAGQTPLSTQCCIYSLICLATASSSTRFGRHRQDTDFDNSILRAPFAMLLVKHPWNCCRIRVSYRVSSGQRCSIATILPLRLRWTRMS